MAEIEQSKTEAEQAKNEVTGPTEAEQSRRRARRAFLRVCGLGALGLLAVPVDARYIEPYCVEATFHEVFLPDLPPNLDGLRVAQLTDLHRGPITPDRTLWDAVALTKAQQPDLVVLTGDYVHRDRRDAAALAHMLAALTPRLGMWGCLGNHDYSDDADSVTRDLANIARVRMLRNDAAQAAPGLWLAGIEDTMRGAPDMVRALAPVPENNAAIVLTHNPVGVFKCDHRRCIALSGHTHGGQVRFPGMAPRLPPGMPGFPLIEGWAVFDQAQLYINRGVGMGGVPFRFNCRPEVAFLTLRNGTGLSHKLPNLASRAVHKAGRVARRALRV